MFFEINQPGMDLFFYLLRNKAKEEKKKATSNVLLVGNQQCFISM